MSRALGWVDLVSYVQEVHSKEGARPNPGFYRLIGNQGLHVISARTGMVAGRWDNGVGGELVLSGNSFPLPTDCLAVESVEWDGAALEQKQADELDIVCPGWRQAVGANPAYFVVDGAEIVFDCTPVVPAEGRLVMRGVGMLPEFSLDSEDLNPLAMLPANLQLAPAYYILSELPFDPGKAVEVSRFQKYSAMWQEELRVIESTLGRRMRRGFRY